jgi:ribosomal protein L37AE/L43A
MNIGVAAHIRAAAPGGKRYCAKMTQEQRKDERNGIWLCQCCAKLIDSDVRAYTVELLESWKYQAEAETNRELENREWESRERANFFTRAMTDVPDYDHPEHFLELAYRLSYEADNAVEKLEKIQRKIEEARSTSDETWISIYEAQFQTTMSLLMSMRWEASEIQAETHTIRSVVQQTQNAPQDVVLYSPGYGGSSFTVKCEPNLISQLRGKTGDLVQRLADIWIKLERTEHEIAEYEYMRHAELCAMMAELDMML